MSTTSLSNSPSLNVLPHRRAISIFLTETFHSPALRDGLKLVVIGGAMEVARRVWGLIYSKVYENLLLEATIEEHDNSYDWLIHFLSQPQLQAGARSFEVSTRFHEDSEDDVELGKGRREEEVDGKELELERAGLGRRKMPEWSLLPSFNRMRWINFEGHYLRIQRSKDIKMLGDPKESLVISTFSRTQTPIHLLLSHARQLYLSRNLNRLQIFTSQPDRRGWSESSSRLPRRMESVVLPRGMKERLEEDVRGFWRERGWYAERGIPHRRGYLLYGVPGSGKTSLCTALAGALGLKIYVVNLSQAGLTDQGLNDMLSTTQSRSMILMEDIDSAFSTQPDEDPKKKQDKKNPMAARMAAGKGKITFSGLLNAIDGVAAQEGNIIFATTNHKDMLDPALARPGRMDVWIEFKNAKQEQAKDLFLNFFPSEDLEQSGGRDANRPPQNSHINSPSVEDLALQFSEAIPDDVFSMAKLQSYLMLHKRDPVSAVNGVDAWIADQTRIDQETKDLETKA